MIFVFSFQHSLPGQKAYLLQKIPENTPSPLSPRPGKVSACKQEGPRRGGLGRRPGCPSVPCGSVWSIGRTCGPVPLSGAARVEVRLPFSEPLLVACLLRLSPTFAVSAWMGQCLGEQGKFGVQSGSSWQAGAGSPPCFLVFWLSHGCLPCGLRSPGVFRGPCGSPLWWVTSSLCHRTPSWPTRLALLRVCLSQGGS